MREHTFKTRTVEEFLAALASSDPTPGGGSAAALAGALASSLSSMVAALAARRLKDKDPERHAVLLSLQGRAQTLSRAFLKLMEADAESYDEVTAALKLPQTGDDERRRRETAVQQALAKAAEVPLKTVRKAVEALSLAEELLPHCPRGARSDLATAVRLAGAAGAAALDSVDANALALHDPKLLQTLAQKRGDLEIELAERAAWVLAPLEEHLRAWLGERDSNPH